MLCAVRKQRLRGQFGLPQTCCCGFSGEQGRDNHFRRLIHREDTITPGTGFLDYKTLHHNSWGVNHTECAFFHNHKGFWRNTYRQYWVWWQREKLCSVIKRPRENSLFLLCLSWGNNSRPLVSQAVSRNFFKDTWNKDIPPIVTNLALLF